MSTTVLQVIEKAYTKVNGEYEAVVESSDDFKTYLNVLNQVVGQWVDTPYVKWQSLFNPSYLLPAVVAVDQLVYPIVNADSFFIANSPLDSVYFVDGAGSIIEKYKITDQAFFDSSTVSTVCAVYSDGLHLKALSSNIIGASIRLPAYAKPAPYTTAAQTVAIDSIPWLVTTMAAFICDASPVPFIARNADKFYKEATVYMKAMRDNNRKRQHLVIKSVTGAAGSNIPTEELLSLMGVGGILGTGGGSSVLDGGGA